MMRFLKLLFRNQLAALGAVVLAVIVVAVLLTPVLPLQNPNVTATGNDLFGHALATKAAAASTIPVRISN